MSLNNTGIALPPQEMVQQNTPSPMPPPVGGVATNDISTLEVQRNIAKQKEDLLNALLSPVNLFDTNAKAKLADAPREDYNSVNQPDIDVPELTEKVIADYKGEKASKPVAVNEVNSDKEFNTLKKENPKALAVDGEAQLKNFDAIDRDLFRGIMKAESGGGQYRIHENAGTSRAIGSFGLLPGTAIKDVIEVYGERSNFAKEYPAEFTRVKDAIEKQDWVSAAKVMADPNIEAEVAKDYLNRTKQLVEYNNLPEQYKDEMLILSWNLGAGGARDVLRKAGEEGVKNHPYVQKVLSGMN